jgi:hypothetical protein
MRNNNLEQFVKLRRELTQEKEQLARRLSQINEALGEMPLPSLSAESGSASPGRTPSPASVGRQAARRGGRRASGGSLRELVIEVLRDGPKTKEEVLEAVLSRGYKFQTNNPLNSLGVILYGRNPKLNRVEGRFSLPGGTSASSSRSSQSAAAGGGKRHMSASARARIAEAQRKRWAASRGERSANGSGAAPQAKASEPGKRRISPAGRRAIAEAARRRWAAARAAGKTNL